MSRDKIEEMAREICGNHYKGDCVGGECICDYQCVYATLANRFYNAGYRKPSEFAREIFEDIDRIITDDGLNAFFILPRYAELKNKYTEV